MSLSPKSDEQPSVTVGMLIFSLGFCALVFWAGWKEISADEKVWSERRV